jgi:hypothetical protein
MDRFGRLLPQLAEGVKGASREAPLNNATQQVFFVVATVRFPSTLMPTTA